MEIKNIFEETIEVTDLYGAIREANKDLGNARTAYHVNKGIHTMYIKKDGKKFTLVEHHSHILNELLKLLPTIQYPDWCFVGCWPSCLSYCDKRKEENGDYKSILRLFFSPLRIEIKEENKKAYPEILELASEQLYRLQLRVNEPLIVTTSGQTTGLMLSTGPDVVIVKY